MNSIGNYKIILGSASPRRKQLLAECGFNFTVRTKEIDETPSNGLKRSEIAIELAQMKSEALFDSLKENEILITADTIVCIDDIVLNKPGTQGHALEMLQQLSNRDHQVYTGVCIRNREQQISFFCETNVYFNLLTEDIISEYIKNYKPFDKAGSYGAQECLPMGYNPCSALEIEYMKAINKPLLFENTLSQINAATIPIIKKIDGSYFNVMGLPVVDLTNQLNTFIERL